MTGRSPVTLKRFESGDALRAALRRTLAAALATPDSGGEFAVMLAGGATPLPAYRALAAAGIAAAPGCCVFMSDERHVPSDADDSNFHAARPLLEALRGSGAEVLRVRTELPVHDAAEDYDSCLSALADARSQFRLGLLGLGADGHTASLFTPADLAAATSRLALAVHRPDGRDAVSVTPALLARFDSLLFVIEGAAKRDALAELLRPASPIVAARAVAGCTNVEAWADEDAARGLC